MFGCGGEMCKFRHLYETQTNQEVCVMNLNISKFSKKVRY